MARKPKHEEHENHERWLISYADFITLLFAFFVVMYSVSSVNEGKYRVLSDSLVAAFRSSARSLKPIQIGELNKSAQSTGIIHSLVDNGGEPMTYKEKNISPFQQKGSISQTGSGDQPEANIGQGHLKGADAIKKMADQLEKAMSGLIRKDLISVRHTNMWVEVEIKTSILFPSGSAKLQNDALPVLHEIARILKDFPNPIRVEGFTDSVPINTVAFPSNWELSAGRAASVVHLFTNEGVEPRRLASIGYGQYRPIADNETPEGRNKNRRVVIVILESEAAERIFSTRSALGSDQTSADGAPLAAGQETAPVPSVPLPSSQENAPTPEAK